MKALKRIVLGSLLFLSVILLGACATTTTTETTSNVTESQTTVTEAKSFTVEIITDGDNPDTQEVETEYVS
ncbi:MAG: hypothetical protein PHW21_04445, partial [Candidatus Izemoplasmatales bacterium]|nr:hypothetical protein [Candidatus Izemoplasmatales bacterium]